MQNLQSATAPSQPMNVTSTTLSTTYGGNNYSVTVSNTPGGMMMFNGQMADTSVLTLTLTKNGTVVSTDNTTAYYLTNPYSPLGLSGTTNGVAWTAIITSFMPFRRLWPPALRARCSPRLTGTAWATPSQPDGNLHGDR